MRPSMSNHVQHLGNYLNVKQGDRVSYDLLDSNLIGPKTVKEIITAGVRMMDV